MILCRIDDGNVLWFWIKGVVGGSHLGSDLIYWVMRRRIFMTKSYIGGEKMWLSMGL